MNTTSTAPLGFAIGRGPYREQPDVIGEIVSTPTGNVSLRIGRTLAVGTRVECGTDEIGPEDGSWEQIAFVTLTPDERAALIRALRAA